MAGCHRDPAASPRCWRAAWHGLPGPIQAHRVRVWPSRYAAARNRFLIVASAAQLTLARAPRRPRTGACRWNYSASPTPIARLSEIPMSAIGAIVISWGRQRARSAITVSSATVTRPRSFVLAGSSGFAFPASTVPAFSPRFLMRSAAAALRSSRPASFGMHVPMSRVRMSWSLIFKARTAHWRFSTACRSAPAEQRSVAIRILPMLSSDAYAARRAA